MEQKKCNTCGRMLPLDKFLTWIRKDGSLGSLHECSQCQHKKANAKFYAKRKVGKLSKIDTESLIEELKRRGVRNI